MVTTRNKNNSKDTNFAEESGDTAKNVVNNDNNNSGNEKKD